MTFAPTGSLVAAAAAAGRGIGAFNVITLEHAEAIVAGAERVGLPVILQVSQNAVLFHSGTLAPISAASRAVAEAATVEVALHLDHVEDVDLVRQAVDHGYGSVMVDASRLDYATNVDTTARLAAELHAQGLWVEAELGEVGGKDGAHAPGVRTDPEEARAFVTATGVDALAVAVGSSHAMTERTARLDTDLIARLRVDGPGPTGPPWVVRRPRRRAAARRACRDREGQHRHRVEPRLHRCRTRVARDADPRGPEEVPVTCARRHGGRRR